MNQIEALQRLRALAAPVVESRDVAAVLQVSQSNATTILRRLASQGMVGGVVIAAIISVPNAFEEGQTGVERRAVLKVGNVFWR